MSDNTIATTKYAILPNDEAEFVRQMTWRPHSIFPWMRCRSVSVVGIENGMAIMEASFEAMPFVVDPIPEPDHVVQG